MFLKYQIVSSNVNKHPTISSTLTISRSPRKLPNIQTFDSTLQILSISKTKDRFFKPRQTSTHLLNINISKIPKNPLDLQKLHSKLPMLLKSKATSSNLDKRFTFSASTITKPPNVSQTRKHCTLCTQRFASKHRESHKEDSRRSPSKPRRVPIYSCLDRGQRGTSKGKIRRRERGTVKRAGDP